MGRRLTILNVAYPLAPVGPDAVGGAEQVLTQLDQALAHSGHHSLVIACEGSAVGGTLIPTPAARPPLDNQARQRAWEKHRSTIDHALQRWPVDLIHLHGVDCLEYLPPPGIPALITLHLPPQWYPAKIFHLRRSETWFHCVSSSQRAQCPPCASLLPEIENGVRSDFAPCSYQKRGFVLGLGRICQEKGFHLALDAAAHAKTPMLLAGQVFPYAAHRDYFNQEILPRLDHLRRFIGPVGFQRKRRLLGSALCLTAPSLVAETSSLVAMEALASGTPVVAFPSGALAGIVEHGKTGFLVKNEEEMADAILRCESIDPDCCRHAALERFNLAHTIQKYLKTYETLAERARRDFRSEGATTSPSARAEYAMMSPAPEKVGVHPD